MHIARKPQQAPVPSCPSCRASFSRPEELRAYVRQRQGMSVGGRPCRSFLFLAGRWKGTCCAPHVHKAWRGHHDKKYRLGILARGAHQPTSTRRPSSVRWTESFLYSPAFDPHEDVEILGAVQTCGRSCRQDRCEPGGPRGPPQVRRGRPDISRSTSRRSLGCRNEDRVPARWHVEVDQVVHV